MKLFLVLLFASTAFAQDQPVLKLSDGKKACTYAVGMKSLSVYYEKVIVVAKKPHLNEDGQPQDEYWVLFVNRAQSREVRDGKTYLKPENVPAESVLFDDPKDGDVMTMRQTRVCKCPPFFWRGDSGISAEH